MELKELTFSELRDQFEAIKSEVDTAKANLTLIKSEIEYRTKPLMNKYGTSHFVIDGAKIKLVKAKDIEWDQKQLAWLYNTIKDDGCEPEQYIKRKITLSVSENDYKQWSDEMQEAFDTARTEKEAKFTFEFEGDNE